MTWISNVYFVLDGWKALHNQWRWTNNSRISKHPTIICCLKTQNHHSCSWIFGWKFWHKCFSIWKNFNGKSLVGTIPDTTMQSEKCTKICKTDSPNNNCCSIYIHIFSSTLFITRSQAVFSDKNSKIWAWWKKERRSVNRWNEYSQYTLL